MQIHFSEQQAGALSRMEMFSMCQEQPRPSIFYGYKNKPSDATALRASQRHNHNDPDELASIHLLHLLEGLPALFPYLIMPVTFGVNHVTNQPSLQSPTEAVRPGD